MTSYRSLLQRIPPVALAMLACASIAQAQGAAMKMDKMDKMDMKKDHIAQMPWGPGPDFLPKGAKMHVVSGNPGAAGPFVVHLMFPNGYIIKPHSHPADEHVKVVAGTFFYGLGDTMDRKAMKAMKKGEEGDLPATKSHYARARGRTVLELSSTGPIAVNYVKAKDDPRGTKK